MNCYEIDEIQVGLSERFQVTITKEKMDCFCQLCGDENPLHLDAEYAKEKGYGDRVVYGMLTSAFISTMVGMYLPGRNGVLQYVDCKFLKPVYIGDTLTVIATVESVHKNVGQIGLHIDILNQSQTKVVKGTAKALIS